MQRNNYLFILLILFNSIIFSQDGVIDSTFDNDGIVADLFTMGRANCYALAIQADGKIIATGIYDDALATIRLNQNGSRDSNFGTNEDNPGVVFTRVFPRTEDPTEETARAIVIQPDLNILIAGDYYGSNLVMARYNSSGQLDNSFDSDGRYSSSLMENVGDMALQSDNKIIIVGDRFDVRQSYNFQVLRLNSDGSSDTNFDSDGNTNTDIANLSDHATCVAIQSDSKIVVAGYSNTGTYYYAAVIRYNSDGTLDTSFSSDGIVTTPVEVSNAYVQDIKIQSDGKMVVAGYYETSTPAKYFFVIRYLSNGELDTSFDSDGIVTLAYSGNDKAYALEIQSDNKILVAGSYEISGGNPYFAMFRLNSDGSLDTFFDDNESVNADISAGIDVVYDMVIQQDGKILLAGSSDENTAGVDFALARFDNPSVFPVELISFTASEQNNKITLCWQTATEVNNYGFEVERCVGQTSVCQWKKVGFVYGQGNSNSPKDYSFIDTSTPLSASTVSYRLKQIDFNGAFTYSNELEVKFDVSIEFSLHQNYPNPFNPSTTIRFVIPNEVRNLKDFSSQTPRNDNEFVTLKIYDILGREVATLVNEQKSAGNYEVKFNASELSSGIYFYKLQSGSFAETKKMALMK